MHYTDHRTASALVYKPLDLSGYLCLGQEQDKRGGSFNAAQSIGAKITQFNLWSRVLLSEEMATIAKCQAETVAEDDLIVTWGLLDSAAWRLSNASVSEVPLAELCKEDPARHKFLQQQQMSSNEVKKICHNIGGKVPVIERQDAVDSLELQLQAGAGGDSRECTNGGSIYSTVLAQSKVDGVWRDWQVSFLCNEQTLRNIMT